MTTKTTGPRTVALVAALALAWAGCTDAGDSTGPLNAPDVNAAPPDGKGGGNGGGNGGGKDKGNKDAATFAVLDIQVSQVDVSTGPLPVSDDPDIQAAISNFEDAKGLGGFFGCPDTGLTCNKIELTYEGEMPQFAWTVLHDARGIFTANELDNARQAVLCCWFGAIPWIPLGPSDGSQPVTFYWQGQRSFRLDEESAYAERNGWGIWPDLEPSDTAIGDDYFVFNFKYDDGVDQVRLGGYGGYTLYPGNRARFEGGGNTGLLWSAVDQFEIETGTSGRGKKATKWARVSLDIQTYLSSDAAADLYNSVGQNVDAEHAVRLTRPDGTGEMLRDVHSGVNLDGAPEKYSTYSEGFQSLTLDQAGCYVVEPVAAETFVGTENGTAVIDRVWDTGNVYWEDISEPGAALEFFFDPNDLSATAIGTCPAG